MDIFEVRQVGLLKGAIANPFIPITSKSDQYWSLWRHAPVVIDLNFYLFSSPNELRKLIMSLYISKLQISTRFFIHKSKMGVETITCFCATHNLLLTKRTQLIHRVHCNGPYTAYVRPKKKKEREDREPDSIWIDSSSEGEGYKWFWGLKRFNSSIIRGSLDGDCRV